ncbi:MAG: 23S rRNA (adenine(2030)-N(6))-methyltransferase RlmJ [Burkholderiaceae bacterium]|jgi:23S rRNA (adenine2030-N6)-methyltransferase|nr:23S rRNA (adenine(2030)-N(6))-methyltransferase RlmJ [Burkholderiaceae bacterium]
MFSYRHAFHAGNHADVFKHTVLIAVLDHLLQKQTALTVLDTHAGAGLYRLDGDFASTSGEAAEGVLRLLNVLKGGAEPVPAIARYLEVLRAFNSKGRVRVYPGSPFIAHHLLRAQDRIKLCELHPTDWRALNANIEQLEAGRRIAVSCEDGFACAAPLLPPPSRRALVLCDPSYEIKTDYARTGAFIAQALARFATGVYMVWYPVIARPEAHALPRRLRTLATQAGKPWLHATLTVKSSKQRSPALDPSGAERRPGLTASGVFIINPPYILREQMAAALPQLTHWLGQDRHAAFSLESSVG